MTETENNKILAGSRLDETSKLDTLSWYLLVIGLMSIGFAGVFLFLKEIRYEDYVLNGVALGRYMLLAGAVSYVGGRGISYYRKYQRKKAGDRD